MPDLDWLTNIYATAGTTLLDDYGVVKVSGPDGPKLLQGQTTNDIEKLSSEQAQLGAICNLKGRVSSLFVLISVSDEELLMLLPTAIVESTIATLNKYGVFFNCELSDVSADWQVFGQYEPTDYPSAEGVPSCKLSGDNNSGYQIEWCEGCFWQLMPKPQSEHQELSNKGAWQARNILAKVPRLYDNTVEVFLPHDLDLPVLNAVSFEKGCYTGQEIVARMHYKGKLKTCVVVLFTDSEEPIAPGDDVYGDNKRLGSVVDCVVFNGKNLLLASTKENLLKSTTITCKGQNASILTTNQ